ncbi:hypothetical protein EJ05DRAFT_140615 [Pseudovirgaria hyperparasitica]|uniref:Uncharacterized protein n=1 Tax=Pseudovirgaria hyperparasitica TaxID=470096 RepID=A0A6A6VX81_9PEZI|nr:uncharacterized protein EJ05DRAFT_140615 [Pseudovirgaria hyperparasitica]KAF2754416.1 hypothetical protein EJ05DRAFT_140615 [Pseudovirgaria hyperparasitica]
MPKIFYPFPLIRTTCIHHQSPTMTAEAPRKRGRPRKIVATTAPEISVQENAPTKATTTRTLATKATKASPKKASGKNVKASVKTSAKSVVKEQILESTPESTGEPTVTIVPECSPERTPQSTVECLPEIIKESIAKSATESVPKPTPQPTPESISEFSPNHKLESTSDTPPEATQFKRTTDDTHLEVELATIAAAAPTVEPKTSATSIESPTSTIQPPTQQTPVTPATSKILKEVNAARATAAELAKQTVPPRHTIPPVRIPPTSVASASATHPPSKKVPQSAERIRALAPAEASRTLSRGGLLEESRKKSAASSASVTATAGPNGPAAGTIGGAPDAAMRYKSTSRKVLTIMVGLPLVIVTSYELYQRLVLGKDRTPLLEAAVKPMREPLAKLEEEQ